MTKTVVITQSNYIPWRGYFDLIRSADEVVLLDCVQYTRRDWRNRNVIKTAAGPAWLTIPVDVKGKYLQSIDQTEIADPNWPQKHIKAIEHAYRRAPHFDALAPWVFHLLTTAAEKALLTEVNLDVLTGICRHLGIDTPIRRSRQIIDLGASRAMEPTMRLLTLAKEVQATRYLSGPTARAYLDVDAFEAAGIEVAWMSYDGYPEYPQLWGEFDAQVSIVDLLMNVGPAAPRYLDRLGYVAAP